MKSLRSKKQMPSNLASKEVGSDQVLRVRVCVCVRVEVMCAGMAAEILGSEALCVLFLFVHLLNQKETVAGFDCEVSVADSKDLAQRFVLVVLLLYFLVLCGIEWHQ